MRKSKYIRITNLNYNMIAVTFVLLTVLGSSCGKENSTATKTPNEKHPQVNYFSVNGTPVIKIHNTKYTVIDYYSKWVPVLYQQKDFDAIEQHIAGLLRDNNEAKSYELHVLYGYLAAVTDEKDVDFMQSVLDEWCGKHGDSHIPWLVRGNFYIYYAWIIRGSGWAKSVPKEGWKQFHAKLELAKKDLEKSWELNPDDPNSSSNLLVVAKGLRYPKEVMEKYFQNGISACPWHFGLHLGKLEYLKPKWHGSSKEMFAFAKQCQALSGQYPFLGLVMVAALFETHVYNPDAENLLWKDDIWAGVEKIYAAFFAKYPKDIRRRFYYAYHANKAKKYEVALKQFAIIGDRWMEHTCWGSLKNYNKGRATAYILKGEDFLINKKLYEISIGYFQKAVKYNPDDYAYSWLGEAYMCSGMSDRDLGYLQQAEENFEKAIQLGGPNSKYAKGELRKLRRFMRKSIF